MTLNIAFRIGRLSVSIGIDTRFWGIVILWATSQSNYPGVNIRVACLDIAFSLLPRE